jgi:fatty-acyl-CoA synthase
MHVLRQAVHGCVRLTGQHRLRLCFGLRSDVWETFQKRFEIPQIFEFYVATEANFSLYNCEGKPGAIRRIPPFLAHRFPVVLVEVDIDTGDPVRNEEGFCRPCAANRVGEAISQIRGRLAPGKPV